MFNEIQVATINEIHHWLHKDKSPITNHESQFATWVKIHYP